MIHLIHAGLRERRSRSKATRQHDHFVGVRWIGESVDEDRVDRMRIEAIAAWEA